MNSNIYIVKGDIMKERIVITKDQLYILIRELKELSKIVESAKRKHNLLVQSKILSEILEHEGVEELIEKYKIYGGKENGINTEDECSKSG